MNAADAGSLTCELSGANMVITNSGTEPLAAGTKVILRLYPPAAVFSAPKQRIVPLKSELAPGGKVTLPINSSGPYESCAARTA